VVGRNIGTGGSVGYGCNGGYVGGNVGRNGFLGGSVGYGCNGGYVGGNVGRNGFLGMGCAMPDKIEYDRKALTTV
jgi:hypothetical protein